MSVEDHRPFEPEGVAMSVLSKMPGVLTKLAELTAAGLASAAGAFLFAQLAAPAAPPPQIVQIAPVQEQLVRAVRSENAVLIEELRKAETAKEAATETAAPRIASVAAAKPPPKPSQASVSGHRPGPDHGGIGADKKSERVYEADMKVPDTKVPDTKAPDMNAPANGRAQSAAAVPLVSVSGSNPAMRVDDSTSAIDQSPAKDSEFRWIARLIHIPAIIFRPAPIDPIGAPRPPRPVGELVSGEM
jgi:hypothetical protein